MRMLPSSPTMPDSSCSQIGFQVPVESGIAPFRRKYATVPGANPAGAGTANWAGIFRELSLKFKLKAPANSNPGGSGRDKFCWLTGAMLTVAFCLRAPGGIMTARVPSLELMMPPSVPKAVVPIFGASTRTGMVADAVP